MNGPVMNMARWKPSPTEMARLTVIEHQRAGLGGLGRQRWLVRAVVAVMGLGLGVALLPALEMDAAPAALLVLLVLAVLVTAQYAEAVLVGRAARASLKARRAVHQERVLSLTEAGVQVATEARTEIWHWRALRQIEEVDGLLILRVEPGLSLAIPSRAFADPMAKARFRTLIEQRLATRN